MTLGKPRARRRMAVLVGAAVAAVVTGVVVATVVLPQANAASNDKPVTFQGLTFDVPASWPVVTLTPTTCVRFDQHAVYLGTPGQNQQCPADMVGSTEALVISPSTDSTAATKVTENTVSQQIEVTGPQVDITAGYRTDRPTIVAILASAGLPAPQPVSVTPPSAHPAVRALATVATLPADATDGSGQGFDACEAPSVANMAAWRTTTTQYAFSTVGIYIGGSDRHCKDQPNLTASWASTVSGQGWHFMPIYLGHQAAFGDIVNGPVEGKADADDAVTEAEALGFRPGSILYYDMEGYAAAQRGHAMALESAWTAELHRLGFLSGIYSSAGSGVQDLVANYGGPSTPDVLWTAHYDLQETTADSTIPAADFANHQQARQYQGGTDVTIGNFPLNVDLDFSDVAISGSAPPPPISAGFHSVSPVRLLDTRHAVGVGTTTPLGAGGVVVLQVSGRAGVPANVTAVVLNITVTQPTAAGFVAVYPDGSPTPTALDVNFAKSQTLANLVTTQVVDGMVNIYNHTGTVHVIADVAGYYTASGAETYHSMKPAVRRLDTRNGTGAPKAQLGAGKSLTVTVSGGPQSIPANVSSVIMNLTVANATANSYLIAYPSSLANAPNVSSMNFAAHQVISNLVEVPVVNGTIKIYNFGGATDVIGDILGYYTPDTSAQFQTLPQVLHVLDTRNGTGTGGRKAAVGNGGTLKLQLAGVNGIPSTIDGVVLNVAEIGPTANGNITVYADGTQPANTPNLYYGTGQTLAAHVIVPVTDGAVDIHNFGGTTNIAIDIAGFYAG